MKDAASSLIVGCWPSCNLRPFLSLWGITSDIRQSHARCSHRRYSTDMRFNVDISVLGGTSSKIKLNELRREAFQWVPSYDRAFAARLPTRALEACKAGPVSDCS